MDTTVRITTGGRAECVAGHWRGRGEWSDVGKLYAVTAGRGWLTVDGRATQLRAGGLYLIPPHHRLAFAATPALTVDWLHFLPLSPVVDAQLSGWERVVDFPAVVARRWRPVTRELAVFFARPTAAMACRVQALVLELIGLGLAGSPPLTAGMKRLLPAVRFMDDHVIHPPPLAVLAAQVNLSPEHFHRLFRSVYRTTPFVYLQRRRMARAHGLLTEGTWSVQEVARACGYDDPYYFSRVFRRQYGCSPRAVRLGQVRPAP